jgi:hypothetical protein
MPDAENAQSAEDQIFDILIQHQRIPNFDAQGTNRCVGCDNLAGEPDGSNSPRHARHLAALIAAAVSSTPEPWPCDNYLAPVTCLTAPSSEAGRCDHCAARAESGLSPAAPEGDDRG